MLKHVRTLTGPAAEAELTDWNQDDHVQNKETADIKIQSMCYCIFMD
jgi:hypothetical protein